MVRGLPAGWGMCYRTVMVDTDPHSLTCWKDTIAVGLRSGSIVTLDGITGTQTAILSGHSRRVRSLAFSPDGTSLVSGSHDKTIKLWDMQTGGVIKTFHGHIGRVLSVTISADCSRIASGSKDKTIRLWDIQTEECFCIITQEDPVACVRFSPSNPQILISSSGGKVLQWDTNGYQTNPTHSGSHVSFSLDGTQLALCKGNDIVIQNANSGGIIAEFHIAHSRADCCCFSPDGGLIAVAAGYIAYVWDTTSSDTHPVMSVVGHTKSITSLEFFSPSSLISSSFDQSVKFWQIDAPPTDPVTTDPISTPLASSPIESITLQSEDGIVISSDSAGVVRTWDILTGLCKASFQTPAKNPRRSDVRLINGQLIFVWCVGKEIHIWDVEKGELQTVNVIGAGNQGVKISGDGSKVFCLHWSSVQAWSVQTGKPVGTVELEVSGSNRSLTVDGSRVWVHSNQSEPLGWDFGIPGLSPVQLFSTSLFHPNDTKLWDIYQSRIEDTATGRVVFQLAGRFVNRVCSQWDGRYLVAGYKSGEVLILDFNHVFQ